MPEFGVFYGHWIFYVLSFFLSLKLAIIAKRNNRSFIKYFLLGFFLSSLIGSLILLFNVRNKNNVIRNVLLNIGLYSVLIIIMFFSSIYGFGIALFIIIIIIYFIDNIKYKNENEPDIPESKPHMPPENYGYKDFNAIDPDYDNESYSVNIYKSNPSGGGEIVGYRIKNNNEWKVYDNSNNEVGWIDRDGNFYDRITGQYIGKWKQKEKKNEGTAYGD